MNINEVKEFSYKGSVEAWPVPQNGLYQLNVYGAQGGNVRTGWDQTGSGGQGGNTLTYAKLDAGDILYVAVGGKGPDSNGAGSWYDNFSGGWNGGCGGGKVYDWDAGDYNNTGGGGGATHIALNSDRGVLKNYQSYQSEILCVAGGGGGSTYRNHNGSPYGGGVGGGTAGGESGSFGTAGGGGGYPGGGGGGWEGGRNGNWVGSYFRTAYGGTGYYKTASITVGGETYTSQTNNGGRSGNGYATVKLLKNAYNITTAVNPINGGTASGDGEFLTGETVTLTATAASGKVFYGWTDGNGNLLSTANPYTFVVSNTDTITANFRPDYTITLVYDNNLGSASYDWNSISTIALTAVLNNNAQFKGWYVNSTQISTNINHVYSPNGNTSIEARFDEVWDINDSVSGHGAIDYTRGTDRNDITFTVIPDANFHFVKYVVNSSTEYTQTPLSLYLTYDTTIVAVFEEDDRFHITASTNFDYGTVSISENDVYAGTTVILKARPFPGYIFVKWEDGTASNPRSIIVNQNITVVAIYQKLYDTNSIYQYRCFVKDQMHLTDPPKAFMVVNKMNIRTDLLTKATSSFEVVHMDLSINEGDVIVVYDPKGNILYNGVIDSFETKSADSDENIYYTIQCSQMQSFYKGNWIYEKGDSPLDTYDNSWYFERYASLSSVTSYPHPSDFEGLTPVATNTYNDNNISRTLNIADSYSAKCTTYIWIDAPFTATVIFETDDNGSVTLNDQLCGDLDSCAATAVNLTFVKGVNKLEVCYTEGSGSDGWLMYLNYQSFPVYSAAKTYNVGDYVSYANALYQCNAAITTPETWTSGHWNSITAKIKIGELGSNVLGLNSTYDLSNTYLEKSIYNILCDYSAGKLVGSKYIDPQVAQRLGGITPTFESSTAGVSLISQDIGTTFEFEDFIYSLYDKYGIIFDFTINFSGNNYVNIKVPNYESISIGNNVFAIKNMAPITEIEDINRLVIFDSQGQYRTTYVATQTDIVEQPDSSVSRFDITNTEIVYSDDPIADLVADSLPQTMYNHKIEFDLILKNNIYDFEEFKLGGPLEIYYTVRDADDYYSSVLTGYELNKESNANISEVHFICGIVRKKLTQLLTLGKV